MTDQLIKTDGTSSGLSTGAAISDTDYLEMQQSVVSPASTVNNQFSAVKTWIKSWIAKADVGLSNVSNNAQLTIANNLSDVASVVTSRANLNAAASDFKTYITGGTEFYSSPGCAGSGSVTLTASVVYLFPFIPRKDVSVSEIDVRVTTGVASTNMQMAIYASDSNGRPTGSPLASNASSKSAAWSWLQLAGTNQWATFPGDMWTAPYAVWDMMRLNNNGKRRVYW